MSLREAWDRQGPTWTAWARTPGHDSFTQFHGECFFSLLPPPGRLTVDLGAGEGRVARALRPRGYTVFEVEGSEYLARANAELTTGRVIRADAARVPLRDGIADLATAFMSMHDIDQMSAAIAEAARILEAGGHLVIAIVHPMNSAGQFEPAMPGRPEHDRRFIIEGSYVDEYQYADDVVRDGLPMRFESMHRPLESYSNALEAAGFAIEALREVYEPEPDSKWSRLPLFLDLRATLR